MEGREKPGESGGWEEGHKKQCPEKQKQAETGTERREVDWETQEDEDRRGETGGSVTLGPGSPPTCLGQGASGAARL